MTAYVHLINGDSAANRLARIAELSNSSRPPVTIFAEDSDPATGPMSWLMGPGCNCCLPATHPRHRLLHIASQPGPVRVIIDAGPPAVADRIAGLLHALPVPIFVHLIRA